MTSTTLRRVAPVFVTTDLARALATYAKLGFAVEAYGGSDFYGFASRDGVEIHLTRINELDRATTTSCAYIWVDDADALFAEWSAVGVAGQFHSPSDTDYGLREGAYVDPDGNLVRFGSPTIPERAAR